MIALVMILIVIAVSYVATWFVIGFALVCATLTSPRTPRTRGPR